MVPLPLMLNDILTMKSFRTMPAPGVFDDANVTAKKCWQKAQRLADEFWHLWRQYCLTTLQHGKMWLRSQQNVAVDDIIILRDEAICRCDWLSARVKAVYPSAADLVRSCKVTIANAKQQDGPPTTSDFVPQVTR